jgi:Timeless protein
MQMGGRLTVPRSFRKVRVDAPKLTSRVEARNIATSTMDDIDFLDLDQSLRDSITGLVSALGGIEYAQPDHPYSLGDDALGCLKDIKKWVKFYGSNGKLDALRCIADTNLVSLDLCQILGHFKEGQENDKIKWRLALNCRMSSHSNTLTVPL